MCNSSVQRNPFPLRQRSTWVVGVLLFTYAIPTVIQNHHVTSRCLFGHNVVYEDAKKGQPVANCDPNTSQTTFFAPLASSVF